MSNEIKGDGNVNPNIYELFKQTRIPMTRKGSYRLEKTLEYLRDHDPAEMRVTEELYRVLAAQCHCDWRAFERSIRVLKDKCWDDAETRKVFEKELNLLEFPKTSDFIKALFYRLEYMEGKKQELR